MKMRKCRVIPESGGCPFFSSMRGALGPPGYGGGGSLDMLLFFRTGLRSGRGSPAHSVESQTGHSTQCEAPDAPRTLIMSQK